MSQSPGQFPISENTLNATIRRRILSRRRGLKLDEIATRSQRVCRRFLQKSGLTADTCQGLKVGMYFASASELNLQELERILSFLGARLFFPRVLNAEDLKRRDLEFVEVSADRLLSVEPTSAAWRAGPYGIQEPHTDLLAIPNPQELDLVLVPGVAFGRQGERLGMGAGFYDRFLARIPRAIRVALAFDFQLLEELEQNSWDQAVDWIITETEEVRDTRDLSEPRVSRWLEARANRQPKKTL